MRGHEALVPWSGSKYGPSGIIPGLFSYSFFMTDSALLMAQEAYALFSYLTLLIDHMPWKRKHEEVSECLCKPEILCTPGLRL